MTTKRRVQQNVEFQEQPKIFSARNGSGGSDRSDNNQMYEIYDNDMSYYNQMQSFNDDDGGVGTSINEGGGGLLLDGNFDEAESHEEFKRALLEWRNGTAPTKQEVNINANNNNNKQKIKKNVDVGTDNSEEQRKSSMSMQQNIELQINFNHSLSYAERLLLKKYRRTDVEEFFNLNTQQESTFDEDKRINSSLTMSRDKTILSGSQHIDFNQLMKVLQVNGEPIKEIENLEEEYTKRLNAPIEPEKVTNKMSLEFEV